MSMTTVSTWAVSSGDAPWRQAALPRGRCTVGTAEPALGPSQHGWVGTPTVPDHPFRTTVPDHRHRPAVVAPGLPRRVNEHFEPTVHYLRTGHLEPRQLEWYA